MKLLGKINNNRRIRSSLNSFNFSQQGPKSQLFNPYNSKLVSAKKYLTNDELFTKISHGTLAFGKWKKIALEERMKLVKTFVESVIADKEVLKPRIAAEIGKSYRNIDEQFKRIQKLYGPLIESGRNALNPLIIENEPHKFKKVVFEPIGLSLLFPYFSEPIFDSLINLIPCLISGNGALLKPSDFNHFLGEYLQKKAAQTFKMDGVVSELFISPPQLPLLSQFRSLKKVLYSGSTQSAKHIFQTLIRNRFIDCNLFFGGMDAAYVDATANLQLAARQIVNNAFYNNGQSYDCLKRVYIEQTIQEVFLELLRTQIAKLKYGNPANPENYLGPLCVAQTANIAEKYINDSISSGAKCQIGGLSSSDGVESGIFFQPTLLSNCTNDMLMVQTQIAAPILCVMTATIQTAADEINQTQYGTGVRIFTQEVSRYKQTIQKLQVGKITFNCGSLFSDNLPIQGWKKSGKGKLLSQFSYQQFSIPKSYNIKVL